MNTTTRTMPPAGQRVTVTEGIDLPRGWAGATATIVGEYRFGQPYVMFDRDIDRYSGHRPEGLEGTWVITDWEVLAPNIGDKVIPLLPGDVAIPAEYHGKVGTVTSSLTNSGSVSGLTIAAEFPSYQKPDDTIQWSFNWWKPAPEEPITFATRQRMIGKTIKVIRSGIVPEGTITTVTSVWDYKEDAYSPKIDGITVGVTYEGNSRAWVQAYEVIEDGQTLTVSDPYRPTAGDTVKITGYLSDSGIVDGLNLEGTVQSVEGDIWMVHTPSLGHVASGPGYVTAIEPKIAVLETDVEPEQTYTKAQYDAIVRERDNLRTRCQQYADDFNLMGELLLDEANRRNWCSDYDDFVETVNSKLGLLQLPDREQEYEVEVEVTGTISTTTTVTVMARSQEDADEMVSDDISSYVDGDDILTDAARNRSFDNIEMEVV